ncbi:MAG: FapA family protein [candidate division Zixibacteria bacterium]|nr:FapA family protein [candidate division Zixibacteria bacterium]
MDAKTPAGQTVATPFSLTVTENMIQVRLSCPSAVAQTAGLIEAIAVEMKRCGITAPPVRESLEQALRHAAETGEDIVDLPIAFGRAPEPPQDGSLEWTAPYFTDGYVVNPETKRIDFRQKAEHLTVDKGQLLVRVNSPHDGRHGEDVYGMPIKVARAKAAVIQAGRQVIWDEKERGYRSRCEGRIRFTGRMLDVDNVFHIAGNVGSATGNIKHNGQLIIDGDIEPDSKVECTGDIDVRGLIYAADIECGGNLVVRSGINQSPEKRMHVGGDVVAKYIHNATLEVTGNVHVETEIFQSSIKTAGEISCTAGRIVGGESMAAGNIIAGEVGSRGNVQTLLAAGLHYELMRNLQANIQTMKKQTENVRSLTPAYKQAMANIGALSAAQREATMEMGFAISEAADQIADLEVKNRELSQQAIEGRAARIQIAGLVHPGTVLRIFSAQHLVEDAVIGPMVAVADPNTGEVTLVSETTDTMENKHER